MSLTVKKETVSGSIPTFINVLETASGGFTLDMTGFTAGDVIPAGQPVGFDESTRVAKVIKTAKLHADATNSATTYQVKKDHNFVVGEFFSAVIGGASYAVTLVDKSNADYDVITLGTTLGVALTAGAILFQGAASGASAGAFFVTPKGLLYESVTAGTNVSLSVVTRGTVYSRRTVSGHASIISALPLIVFSQSY